MDVEEGGKREREADGPSQRRAELHRTSRTLSHSLSPARLPDPRLAGWVSSDSSAHPHERPRPMLLRPILLRSSSPVLTPGRRPHALAERSHTVICSLHLPFPLQKYPFDLTLPCLVSPVRFVRPPLSERAHSPPARPSACHALRSSKLARLSTGAFTTFDTLFSPANSSKEKRLEYENHHLFISQPTLTTNRFLDLQLKRVVHRYPSELSRARQSMLLRYSCCVATSTVSSSTTKRRRAG